MTKIMVFMIAASEEKLAKFGGGKPPAVVEYAGARVSVVPCVSCSAEKPDEVEAAKKKFSESLQKMADSMVALQKPKPK
jgi:hypothetical protein